MKMLICSGKEPTRRGLLSAVLYASLLLDSTFVLAADGGCPVPADAVSWWRAESNALDSAGTNHGVLQGGVTFAAGKVGQALSLDGIDDFVQVPSASGFPVLPSGNAPRTLALWFKTPRNLSVVSNGGGLIHYGTYADNARFGLITSLNAPGKLYVFLHGWPQNDFSSATTLQPDAWYHGAVTYNGSTVKLYLNGQLEATRENVNLNTVIDGNGLLIGNYVAFWQGLLDEIYVFNRAFSAGEIAALYAAGLAGQCYGSCPLASIRVSEIEVCWQSRSNGLYQVDYRSDLTTNLWLPLYTNVVGNGEVICLPDRVTLPQRFYRIVCQTNQLAL